MPPVFVHAMPAINPGAGASNGPQQQQRATFRPPWVKDGPEPLPMPAAPWTLARARQKAPEQQDTGPGIPNLKPVPRKNSTAAENSSGPSAAPKAEPAPVRKTSKITIIPSRPVADAEGPKENGHDAANKVKTNTTNSKPKQQKAENETKPKTKQIPIEIKSTSKPKLEETKQKSISKKEEEPKVAAKPPQPPAPPMPPPPPPIGDMKPISASKAEKLGNLRSRPKKRPDWGKLMKEVETGHERLKHVQCNDRSSPLIPMAKVKGRFMYDSEKPNVHNELLKEIQSGIRLKKVQTNDRSKPQLDGLRKFRRQLTIEEQIQKAEAEEQEAEPDELDDIDKVRDDLQSTKQMLALELRNKEAMERENKKLLTRILNLEVELEKERAKKKSEEQTPQARREEDEQEKKKLRKELGDAQKAADEMESKYHDTVGQLDMARADIEDMQRKNQMLEKRLQLASIQNQGGEQPLRKQPSSKKLAKESTGNVQEALEKETKAEEEEEEDEEVVEVTETESESSSDEEEDAMVLQERRMARELKLLATKLKTFKDKEEASRKERRSLREQLKKQQKILKEEKKKYKQLQKEVDNVANMMKDDEEDEDEEEEEEEESESESESEESEEEESDGDLPDDAPVLKRKLNLTERAKRHENCLAALRKGNYLLKANVDKLKDDLFKQKEMSAALQEDLNSVLAELG